MSPKSIQARLWAFHVFACFLSVWGSLAASFSPTQTSLVPPPPSWDSFWTATVSVLAPLRFSFCCQRFWTQNSLTEDFWIPFCWPSLRLEQHTKLAFKAAMHCVSARPPCVYRFWNLLLCCNSTRRNQQLSFFHSHYFTSQMIFFPLNNFTTCSRPVEARLVSLPPKTPKRHFKPLLV